MEENTNLDQGDITRLLRTNSVRLIWVHLSALTLFGSEHAIIIPFFIADLISQSAP